ncbi:MAG: Major facilitator superfamily [Parcubacteria group bacterium GW2011_GWA2_31_28]|nr:MAG: Major facilitator superfamily [Parcubacteria group bacterium GW2011_GWA2_31_28]
MNRFSLSVIALKYRDFRLLWIGLLLSAIGSQMQIVAITWHVYLVTKSALSLGYIGLARFIPLIIFAFIGGIAADKYNRKIIIFLAVTVMASTAILLTIATYTNSISPLLIYITLAINSVASSFESPARNSLTPSLVPRKHLMNAVSLNTIMWQSSLVIGPSIAGFVIAYLGIGSVYLINALSFAPIVFSLLLMNSVHKKYSSPVSFNLKSFMEGLRFVRNNPIIFSTMLLDFFATFFSSATVLLPIFAKDILKVGPQGLGFLYAAPSIGAIIAGLIVSSHRNIKNQGKMLIYSVILYGIATILFGVSRSFYLSLLFLALTGAGDVISTILRNTIRQLLTPDHLRGRMSGINLFFFMGGPQLGEVEAGLLATLIGTPLSVVTGGLGTIIATFWITLLIPKLKKYQGNEVVV